jgi:hypothetical protein
MAHGVPMQWSIGFILIVIALGLLGAFLQNFKPCRCGHKSCETEESKAAQRRYDEGVKWAFYVFVWLMTLYMYTFTHSAFKKAASC